VLRLVESLVAVKFGYNRHGWSIANFLRASVFHEDVQEVVAGADSCIHGAPVATDSLH
jgi:hypothetical protein